MLALPLSCRLYPPLPFLLLIHVLLPYGTHLSGRICESKIYQQSRTQQIVGLAKKGTDGSTRNTHHLPSALSALWNEPSIRPLAQHAVVQVYFSLSFPLPPRPPTIHFVMKGWSVSDIVYSERAETDIDRPRAEQSPRHRSQRDKDWFAYRKYRRG